MQAARKRETLPYVTRPMTPNVASLSGALRLFWRRTKQSNHIACLFSGSPRAEDLSTWHRLSGRAESF